MRQRVSVVVAASLLMAWAGSLTVASADEETPADLLKAKGLTQSGVVFILEVDMKMPERLRALRAAQRKLDDHAAKRSEIEKEIRTADDAISDLYRKLLRLDEVLSKTSTNETSKYNGICQQIDGVRSKLTEAARFKEQHYKDLKKLGDSPDDYVSTLVQLAEDMETAAGQYTALAADDEVKRALSRLHEKPGPKVRLGPSDPFKEELPWVRKQREKINSAVIKFNTETGGVPQVKVTLNGSLEIRMVVDSGAAIVSLTSDVANRLGLKPGPDDPVAHLVSADGKVTDAKLMTLKSVRLGGFTVENVPCAVKPRSDKGADCLLGGTFLRNFICRIDLTAGEMRLSQMSGTPGAKFLATTAPSGKDTNSPRGAPSVARTEVIVAATRSETNPVATGIRRNKGESLVIKPDAADTWAKGEGSHDGKRCDYKGYADKPGWMALRWKIGNTSGPVGEGAVVVAQETGELLLYCNDDSPAENGGAIRAAIILKTDSTGEAKGPP